MSVHRFETLAQSISTTEKDSFSQNQTHSAFFHLRERFNADKLHYILEHYQDLKRHMPSANALVSRCSQGSDEGNADSKEIHDPLHLARKYLQKSRNGSVDVVYAKASQHDRGRWYAVGSLSLQSFKKVVRHTIASEYYSDLDIKCCHPTILQHMCHTSDIACPFLDEYVANTGEIQAATHLEPSRAKKLYLALTNGGNRDFDSLETSPNAHMQGYKLEMIRLHRHFSQQNPELLEKVKEKRRSQGKDYNHEAALTNVLICQIENNILMAMYDFFGKPKDAVLCFDGIMLPKQNPDNMYDLAGCAEYVAQTIGIQIELCVKPMDKCLPIPTQIPQFQYPPLEYYSDFIPLVHMKVTTLEWIQEWSHNTLKLIENGGKPFFLTKNQKIEAFGRPLPSATMSTIDDWLPIQCSDLEKSLKVRCMVSNPFYSSSIAQRIRQMDKKSQKNITPYERQRAMPYIFETLGATGAHLGAGYLSYLMENRMIDSFDQVVFYPFLAQKGAPLLKNCFNLFTGFPPEKNRFDSDRLPPFEESRFYRHLKSEFFNDNQAEFDHFLDHMADIIQDPASIKGTSHLFYSRQGTGKGLLAEFISELIGHSNVAIIINTDLYFDKNFNADRVNKLLKIFEEVSEKGSAFKNHNRLKGEQTSNKERIENKGIDPYYTLHCARFWYFTNNENSLYIENDDRRHTLHRINNRMANNHEYFRPIWEEIRNPDFILSAFSFLANRVYTSESVLNSFHTQYKSEQKIANIPNGIKFLIDYVQRKFSKAEDKDLRISSLGIREEWKVWCQNQGCPYNLGTLQTQWKSFGIPLPKQFRVNGAQKMCYSLNVFRLQADMQQYLKDPSWTFDFGEAVEQEADFDSGFIEGPILT